jgi:hypothetical protein
MSSMTLTYGVMPSQTLFEAAFDHHIKGGYYSFRNDKRVGNSNYSSSGLYQELVDALSEGEDMPDSNWEETQDWVSCVLSTLGFEWI